MKINEKIGERIKESRMAKGLASSQLALNIGVSKQIITNWEKGRRTPTLDNVIKLSKELGSSVNYLLCIDEQLAQETSDTPLYNLTDLPDSSPDNVEEIKIPPQFNFDSHNTIAVRLTDNSMKHIFRKSDIVLIDKKRKPYDNCFVLIKIKSTGQTLFRQYVIDNTNITNPEILLVPTNKDFNNIVYNEEAITIVGVCSDELRLIG